MHIRTLAKQYDVAFMRALEHALKVSVSAFKQAFSLALEPEPGQPRLCGQADRPSTVTSDLCNEADICDVGSGTPDVLVVLRKRLEGCEAGQLRSLAGVTLALSVILPVV